MSDELDRVRAAATDYRDAGRALRRAVASAHSDGASVTDLAEAARVTRKTVYSWLAAEGSGRIHVVDALREACRVLAYAAEDYSAQQVAKRLNSDDPAVLAMGVKIGMANISNDARRGLTEDERAALAVGSDVAARGRERAKSGEWPETLAPQT